MRCLLQADAAGVSSTACSAAYASLLDDLHSCIKSSATDHAFDYVTLPATYPAVDEHLGWRRFSALYTLYVAHLDKIWPTHEEAVHPSTFAYDGKFPSLPFLLLLERDAFC